MSRWKDNFQMYWPHAIATPMFCYVAWHYVRRGQWEANLPTFALAALGFLSVVASDEVASWTGRYSWTYDGFWTYPPTYVRFFGFLLLVAVILRGF